jgi:hypothetical protein
MSCSYSYVAGLVQTAEKLRISSSPWLSLHSRWKPRQPAGRCQVERKTELCMEEQPMSHNFERDCISEATENRDFTLIFEVTEDEWNIWIWSRQNWFIGEFLTSVAFSSNQMQRLSDTKTGTQTTNCMIRSWVSDSFILWYWQSKPVQSDFSDIRQQVRHEKQKIQLGRISWSNWLNSAYGRWPPALISLYDENDRRDVVIWLISQAAVQIQFSRQITTLLSASWRLSHQHRAHEKPSKSTQFLR